MIKSKNNRNINKVQKKVKSKAYDPKLIQKISVYKNKEFIGYLNRTQMGCELHIDPNYKAKNPDKYITYHISTVTNIQTFNGVGLPAYFAGLLPEGLRLKALTKKIKTSPDDMFSLLVAAGNDPIGDLHFSINENRTADISIFSDFKKIKQNIRNITNSETTSVAGVQDKISTERISLPIQFKNKNKSYILKLASDEFGESIENEMICLVIAKSCGLKVNQAQIVQDKNNIKALLVERFDRSWDDKSKNWIRWHQEDACQFLNKYPADKYNISLQDIAEGIQKFASSPEIEVLKLLELKAFSYLIGNGDLHAKNITLLNDQLSPCYDLLCTAIYGDHKMALLIDGKNQNLKRKTFINFGQRYGLSDRATELMLDRLINKFEKNYEKIFVLELAQTKRKSLTQMFKTRIKNLSN